MSQTRRFDQSSASVRAARRFVATALSDLPPAALDVVVLMVSELASNCVRHTDSGFALTVSSTPNEIRVEATDRGGGEPRKRSPAPTDPDGRGLQIVDVFSSAWGIESAPGHGKTVWFTVAMDAPVAPEPASA